MTDLFEDPGSDILDRMEAKPANLPKAQPSAGHAWGKKKLLNQNAWTGLDAERHGVEKPAKEGPNKPDDGLRRIMEHYAKEGWTLSAKVETKDISGDGMVVKRDWLGFADLQFLRAREGGGTEVMAVQETTLASVGAHVQKVSNPKNRIKFLCTNSLPKGNYGEASILDNLRDFLAVGGIFVIWGWHKPERTWEGKILVVDEAQILKAQSRQRK